MVKFVVLSVLMSLVLLVDGTLLPIPGLFRGDPFPEPKTWQAVPSNVQLNNITQRVDNFDPTNHATWQQQFYSNNEFYQPGGPIFVFLAGNCLVLCDTCDKNELYEMMKFGMLKS